MVKLGSADGHEVWRTVIDGTEHGLDRAFAITTDPAGDIVAVGDTTNAAFGEDILVVKLTGTDGREVWRRVIGPSPEARVVSHASSVAINPTGDVLVAGSVSDVEVHQTFTVLKLAGADGVELWRAEMGEGQAGVALDDDGDVIACGTVGEQFVVTKRSGTDGSELWTRMVGPGEGYTVSVRAGEQVFAGGRLTVPGNLATPGDPGNFVVVRLDGQTGNELWRTVIDGTFNGQPEGDWVNALAVDAAGDVVAVGRTVNVHTGVDFTVVKLPGATGEVGPSAVVTCSVDAECDDGDPCTVEHCIVGEGCISGLAQAPLECRSTSFARSLHDIIFRIRSVDARQLGGRNHARKLLALVVKARQRVRRDGRRHAPPSDRALERTGRLLAKFRIGIFVARQRRAMNFSLAQSLTEHLPCLFPECCPYVSVCAPPR